LIFGDFLFGYSIFEIPSNLLLHKIGARLWIARILISWGIVAMLTGFAQDVSQLYVARFLLGLAEAGYFPGIVLYLTYWFPNANGAGGCAVHDWHTRHQHPGGSGFKASSWITCTGSAFSSWRWLLILEARRP